MIDTTTETGGRVAQRLQTEHVIWLTTVRADGQPQSSPVWFLWDGDTFLIYSQPTAQKLRNIRRHPGVSLHLNSDERGGNVVTIDASATIEADAPPANAASAYGEKYRDGIGAIGHTPESLAQTYSVALRVTPRRVRAW